MKVRFPASIRTDGFRQAIRRGLPAATTAEARNGTCGTAPSATTPARSRPPAPPTLILHGIMVYLDERRRLVMGCVMWCGPGGSVWSRRNQDRVGPARPALIGVG